MSGGGRNVVARSECRKEKGMGTRIAQHLTQDGDEVARKQAIEEVDRLVNREEGRALSCGGNGNDELGLRQRGRE